MKEGIGARPYWRGNARAGLWHIMIESGVNRLRVIGCGAGGKYVDLIMLEWTDLGR